MNKKSWGKVASKTSVEKTIDSLKKNGIEAEYFESGADAKNRVFKIIPKDVEIMNMTSVTLNSLGIAKEIESSGRYNAIRPKLYSMNMKTQGKEMQKLGAAPEYAIGSAQAVTEEDNLIIASATGSQLPAYAYGSSQVIFVVGTNKIVKNIEEGMKRIYEHSLPLESERAKKAYGVPGSFVSKILIINKEIVPNRIKILFVNEVLGF